MSDTGRGAESPAWESGAYGEARASIAPLLRDVTSVMEEGTKVKRRQSDLFERLIDEVMSMDQIVRRMQCDRPRVDEAAEEWTGFDGAENQLAETEDHVAFPDYVLVLINANACLIKPELLERGADGARHLADTLSACIKDGMRHLPIFFDTQIAIEVYANFATLAGACKAGGWEDRYAMIQNFASGFEQLDVFFKFVDAGRGKKEP